jgi:hypothetical protein
MSEQFIERLSEVAVLADGGDGVSREQLERAIDWLARAAPENGVDLVPWWEGRLQTEAAAIRRRHWRWPVGLAASLLVGLALGAAAGAGFSRSQSTAPIEHYSTRQQQIMFALLDPSRQPPAGVYQSAATELVGCYECHEALRRRLAAGSGRPVVGDQSNATPTLRSPSASAIRGIRLCRQDGLWQSGLQLMVWQECWSAATTLRSNTIVCPSRNHPCSETATINPPLAWSVPPSALRRSAMAS